jgi:hypothetical protein
MEKIAAKLGAVLYVCWGLLHFIAAYGVLKLVQNSSPAMAQGRLMQTAFYLAAFATAAIIIAITLNWRNDTTNPHVVRTPLPLCSSPPRIRCRVSFLKTPSGQIRAMRQNQRIIRCLSGGPRGLFRGQAVDAWKKG